MSGTYSWDSYDALYGKIKHKKKEWLEPKINRYFCEICKCWMANNKISIQKHEYGEKHKEQQEQYMKDMRIRNRERQDNEGFATEEIKRIEEAAVRKYFDVDASGVGKDKDDHKMYLMREMRNAESARVEKLAAWQELKERREMELKEKQMAEAEEAAKELKRAERRAEGLPSDDDEDENEEEEAKPAPFVPNHGTGIGGWQEVQAHERVVEVFTPAEERAVADAYDGVEAPEPTYSKEKTVDDLDKDSDDEGAKPVAFKKRKRGGGRGGRARKRARTTDGDV